MEIAITIILWGVIVAFLASTGLMLGLIIKYDRQHRAEQKRTEELTDNLITKIKRIRENREAKDESDEGGGD